VLARMEFTPTSPKFCQITPLCCTCIFAGDLTDSLYTDFTAHEVQGVTPVMTATLLKVEMSPKRCDVIG
jgi:hypothetical protein